MNAVVAIVRANLVRMVNNRANAFFIIVLPLLIVFALGSAIGSSAGSTLVGVVDPSPTAAGVAVLHAMEATEGVEIRRYESASALRDDVARRIIDVGWSTSNEGDRLVLIWYAGSGEGLVLRGTLENTARAVDVRNQLVSIVATDAATTSDVASEALDRARSSLGTTPVTITAAGDPANDPSNITAVLASGELTLFIFLTSLTGAGYLVLTRQYGVTRRMRAGPVAISAIIVGEGISRYLVALFQAGIVITGSTVLFGVDWKSPAAVIALSMSMALVGSGAAMLLGTVARNEQQAGAVALLLALVLAALGGSMQPLHYFPDTLRSVAFATPHAWMNDALWKILVDGAGLAEVWPSVAVLAGAGLALASLASGAMARSLR